MALEAGNLTVTLHYAQGIKDMDWIGKQDPYARLRIGSQERCSGVCRGGGRNPVWDETFEFTLMNENTLEITLMDEDWGMQDDLIGTATISLASVREHGRDAVQAPVSSGKKTYKQKGMVQVSLSFVPNSKLRPDPGVQPLAYQPAPMPAPAAAYGYPGAQLPVPGVYACQNPVPYVYGYPPASSYGPSPGYYSPAPAFQYSPPVQQPPAPPGWPVPQPGYGVAPPAAPLYLPQPPAPAPGYGGYHGVAGCRS